ncbi:MAG: OmpA family protein [Betaproteobacteria bacterium]|jgi:outer membrane protein OmpA-like peptidoglycan-associated protein|nr:OmpA family protein [Betaproteobacteria bacterium]
MNAKLRLLTILSLTVLVSACGKDDGKKAGTPAVPEPAPETSLAPQAAPAPQPAPPQAAPEPAAEPAPAVAAFDINVIPVSNKDIGEFPFFTPPEGHRYVTGTRDNLNENESLKKFTRYYFPVGKESLYPVEGKTLKATFYNEERKSTSNPDVLVIQRNYENAITAAGGVKVFDGEVEHSKTYGALSSEDRNLYGPESYSDTRQVYVIRKQDMEIWFEINCGAGRCYFTVTQKGEMKQTVGVVPVSEMKEALDKVGHIALYINFDTDKASIRPYSQGTIDEIVKLLETYPDLKIRIEGHTDDTGGVEHNATLSENRASSVYGALLARGISQNRLEAKGFGTTHPIANNGTEEGRAKNRRVEIVKTSA